MSKKVDRPVAAHRINIYIRPEDMDALETAAMHLGYLLPGQRRETGSISGLMRAVCAGLRADPARGTVLLRSLTHIQE